MGAYLLHQLQGIVPFALGYLTCWIRKRPVKQRRIRAKADR